MIRSGAKAMKQEWRDHYGTPDYILACVDECFGGREEWFDPCPVDPTFNGLKISGRDLPVKMFFNPPFSRYTDWVERWLYSAYALEQIWICNSSTEARWYQMLLCESSMLILTKTRVKFIDPRTGLPAGQPERGNTIFYIGANNGNFRKAFEHLGTAVKRC